MAILDLGWRFAFRNITVYAPEAKCGVAKGGFELSRGSVRDGLEGRCGSRERGKRRALPAICLIICLSFLGSDALGAPAPKASATDLPGLGRPQSTATRSHSFPREEDRIPGSYIVVLEDSVANPAAIAKQQLGPLDGDLHFVYRSILNGYSATGLSRADVDALRASPQVKYVSPNLWVEAQAQTIPTGISRISAATNPTLDIDEADDARIDVDVAIIDTGIDYTHPDLDVVSRTNCVPVGETGTPECVDNTGTDGAGHGTHVSGIVGAIDNGFGSVGVAPGARLWAVRVLNNEGSGALDWIVAGMEWVTKHASQIEVANMSLGAITKSPPMDAAIKASVEAGVVYVVAAGNFSFDSDLVSPANSPDVIAVSALADYDGKPGGKESSTCKSYGSDDQLASFSNWGDGVDLAAPGVCIYSTLPEGQYGMLSGTSMASPYVAGAAAVLASASNPNSRQDVEGIRNALVDAGSLDWVDTSEDGRPEPLLYLGQKSLEDLEVASGGWSAVGQDVVTLHGSIQARGAETTYWFEYGETAEYGHQTPLSPAHLSSGAKYQLVSRTITGLKPNTAYHFRLVAENGLGKKFGSDHQFVASQWGGQGPGTKPPLESTSNWVEDLSCTAQNFCLAVGNYKTSQGVVGASYRRNAANEWDFVSMPTAEGHVSPTPHGVSCASSTACTAVGWDGFSSMPEAWRWNGSSWSTQATPLPSGASKSQLTDVECPTTTECLAVGTYWDSENKSFSYSAVWKSGSWSVVAVPQVSGSAENTLWDVACSSASACTAVGWFVSQASVVEKLIVRWSGSGANPPWSLQTPAQGGAGMLRAVSCSTATSCVAVGNDFTEPSALPIIEAWNGSSWASKTPAQPQYQQLGPAWLDDISCLSANYCRAVGVSHNGFRAVPLAEVWNGSAWQVDALPQQVDDSVAEPLGVSCLPLRGCFSAVSTFTEQWETIFLEEEGVYTGEATGIAANRATLHGVVNPGGKSTTYYFEYGKTTEYGKKAPIPNGSAGSGNNQVAVEKELVELDQEATYHYRLVATNLSGTVYGKDRTLRTASVAPTFKYSFGATGTGNGQLKRPRGVAVDGGGNVWVVDSENNRVQKFSSQGEYLLKFGSSGSGNGQFSTPVDIAIAPGGDLWVTDSGNDRVQKFNAKGEYSSQVGSSGTSPGKFVEPSHVAVDSAGNIWVSDRAYNRVQEFSGAGSFIRAVGAAEYGGNGQTSFSSPRGIAIDGNDHVWVADRGNHRLVELSPTGQYLGSIGEQGNGDGQLDLAESLDVKASGDLLATDVGADRVQQLAPTGTSMGEFGEPGLLDPEGIAVAPDGVVYVANSANNRVELWQQPIPKATTKTAYGLEAGGATITAAVDPRGTSTSYRFEYGLTTAYGSQTSTSSVGSGTQSTPVIVSLGGLLPSTTYHFRIVAFNSDAMVYGKDMTFATLSVSPTYSSTFGTAGSGDGQFKEPANIAVNPANGNIVVADRENNRIQVFTEAGQYIRKFGSKGTGDGQFDCPTGVAVDAKGNIWVADQMNHRVEVFTENGEFIRKFGSNGSANGQFNMPTALVVDPKGNVWVADMVNSRVQKFTEAGAYVSKFSTAGWPRGVAVGPDGHIWNTVNATGADKIEEHTEAGAFVQAFGKYGEGNGELFEPRGLELDPAGNVWVVEGGKRRVQVFSSQGAFLANFGSQGAGSGQLETPWDVGLDPSGGVWISDTGNKRISRWMR